MALVSKKNTRREESYDAPGTKKKRKAPAHTQQKYRYRVIPLRRGSLMLALSAIRPSSSAWSVFNSVHATRLEGHTMDAGHTRNRRHSPVSVRQAFARRR